MASGSFKRYETITYSQSYTEAKFREGQLVVYKTVHKLSALAVEYAHEQNNDLAKSDGDAVGPMKK